MHYQAAEKHFHIQHIKLSTQSK